MDKPTPHPTIPNVQIFESQSSSGSVKKFLSEWILSVKVVYSLLALIILMEVYFGLKTLLSPLPSVERLAPIGQGVVVLTTDQSSYLVGDQIPVTIKLSTGGYNSVGADLVLKFDPNLLEAVEGDFFEKGEIYQDYPGTSLDKKNGMIFISGIVLSGEEGFNGTGIFGRLKLVAKKSGVTLVKVEFQTDSTTDSNIIDTASAKDVLGQAIDVEINIGQPGKVPRAEQVSCAGFTQLCWDGNNKQSTQQCQPGRLKDQTCVFDPILTESCGQCGQTQSK